MPKVHAGGDFLCPAYMVESLPDFWILLLNVVSWARLPWRKRYETEAIKDSPLTRGEKDSYARDRGLL